MKAVRLIDQLSPRTQYADWINTIGNIFFEKEFYDYALECYLIGLKMRLDCLPNEHLDIAESLMFLGDVYIKKDYLNQAQSYYEKALIIYENKEHVNSNYVLSSIGTIYENMSEYHIALQYYKRASAFRVKYFPLDNPMKIINEDNTTRVQ
ncbi:unnamed protein product, partial [Rotaria sordida]